VKLPRPKGERAVPVQGAVRSARQTLEWSSGSTGRQPDRLFSLLCCDWSDPRKFRQDRFELQRVMTEALGWRRRPLPRPLSGSPAEAASAPQVPGEGSRSPDRRLAAHLKTAAIRNSGECSDATRMADKRSLPQPLLAAAERGVRHLRHAREPRGLSPGAVAVARTVGSSGFADSLAVVHSR